MAKIKKYQREKSLKEEAAALDVELDESKLTVKEVRKLFKRGNLALSNNNYPLAAKNFFKAWEADQDNLYLLTVVSHLLSKLGHQTVAIEFLEKAIALHGLTEDICKIMGEMALSLGMFEAAEKIFSQAVQFNPQEEKYYINISAALEGQGNTDGAIQFMTEVVKILDESSDCWCQLGTLLKNNSNRPLARAAFEKSLAINPKNIIAVNNFSGLIGVGSESEKLLREVINFSPVTAEPHVMLATCLLYKGQLKEAWEHYEYRNDSSRGPAQTAQCIHNIKEWNGQPLKGKTIFLVAEQGLGDEIFYAQAFHKLADEGASLIIGCDKRLVDIYERSFPGSKAFAYVDNFKNGVRYRFFPKLDALIKRDELKVDYSLSIGSVPLHYWSKTSDIKQFPDGYIRACDAEVEIWKTKFQSLGSKPKIGLSWRSGYLDKTRADHYHGLHSLLPLIEEIDADYVCLQYDYTQEEIDEVKSKTGKSLLIWPEIDLKNDIEANLAIMANLDLVMGPNIATQMLSLACGAKTWLLSARPWWAWVTAEDNTIHHAPKSSYWRPYRKPNYGDIMWSFMTKKVMLELKKGLNSL